MTSRYKAYLTYWPIGNGESNVYGESVREIRDAGNEREALDKFLKEEPINRLFLAGWIPKTERIIHSNIK